MYLFGRHTRTRPSRRPRLEVEAVEGRQLLSTLFVNPKVPQDFHTIQSAVNAAHPGDTIEVAPGTYHETVFIDKTLTLLGAQAGVNPITGLRSNGANESTVDGIAIGSTSNVRIDGFSLNDPDPGPPLDRPTGQADTFTNNIVLPGSIDGGGVRGGFTTVSDNRSRTRRSTVSGRILDIRFPRRHHPGQRDLQLGEQRHRPVRGQRRRDQGQLRLREQGRRHQRRAEHRHQRRE